ncbi:MAG TPA: response regulator [Marinagarivorans sp.]
MLTWSAEHKAQDVRDNYPLRTAVMWVVFAIHVSIFWSEPILPSGLWVFIALHTLLAPHLLYLISSQRIHECYNLLFDVAMYGLYVGLWGFNPFLAAVFIATSNLTLVALGGLRLLALAIVAQGVGAVIGGWITGFYFRLQIDLVPMAIATAGFFSFMVGVGLLMHRINHRLHSTRNRLKERHAELSHINELAVAVNSQLTIDSIIRRLLDSLEQLYPLEAVYFLSHEPARNILKIAGVYGEAISYKERAQFEALEFDFERDANSIFVMGLKQRRVINIAHLLPNAVEAGAEIDRRIYDIKPSLSVIYFPVYVEDKVVGGLAFINHKHHCVLGKHDVRRIADYLVQVGTAIKNANLIRQLKKAKEEALCAQKKAEASEEAKSRFLANMSHEIRTPMTAILGYSEALQEADLSDQERIKFVDIIMSSGRHLLSMINNILDISKIEASRAQVEKIDIDLVQLFNDVENYLVLEAGKKSLACSVTVNYPVPERIVNDPTRLKQVLLNLCNNAIKFTERGSVNVSLSWPSPRLMSIHVSDTGIGMTEQECSSVFEAFAQADSSTTRLYGGTGLGLTISKSLALLMGGNLEVVSEKGVGSTFMLTIDTGDKLGALIESPEAWQRLRKKLQRGAAEDTIRSLEGTILVAEDNPVNQQIIKRLLEKSGLDVVLVDDGEQAVEQAKKHHFDVIFLDMQMPVMGGQAAAKAIINAGISTPLVAFTANVMNHQVQSYLRSGFIDVIEKPIDKKKLFLLLTRLLRSSASCLKKVLVVDDDETNVMIATRQIKHFKASIEVLVATNGKEALTKVDSAAIDLIFMDMEMPVMGGLEAMRILRRQGFINPIYMVTGNIDQEHKSLCLAAGATGHLPKPLDKNKIRSVLELY